MSALPAGERAALGKLVEASRIMDALFLRQVWGGNDAMLQDLARLAAAPAAPRATRSAAARLHYFLINKGPWDRDWTTTGRSFRARRPSRSPRTSIRPDATKADIQKWIDSLSRRRESAPPPDSSPRSAAATSTSSSCHTASSTRASWRARPSSCATRRSSPRDAALKKFLTDARRRVPQQRLLRQRRRLDGARRRIEPTIGPYEVYEDEWFNFKAAFEAFITLRDEAETKKLQVFSDHLQDLEDNLPIDPSYRNPKLGALAPIRVVNVVFAAGDGNRGVQTAAFNLPNDERVVKEKGTKRVMLKNVQDAKFKLVLLPISKWRCRAADQKKVSFDAFFTHILMHELMHGLGPHNITVGGRADNRAAGAEGDLQRDRRSQGRRVGTVGAATAGRSEQIDPAIAKTMYTTFLASAFRSIRFGLNEAHGRGIAIQLNYFLDAGAFKVRPDGTFTVDDAKIADAVTALTREIMTLQAEGSYAKAKESDRSARRGTARGAEAAGPTGRRAGGHRAEVHHGCGADEEIEQKITGPEASHRRTKIRRPYKNVLLILCAPVQVKASWVSRSLVQSPHDVDGNVGPVRDDAVDAPPEQPLHVVGAIDRPDLHRQSALVRVPDEARRDHARSSGRLRHLEGVVGRSFTGHRTDDRYSASLVSSLDDPVKRRGS